MQKLIGNKFLRGSTTEQANFKDFQFTGLYFSASWCAPCKKFTPQLINIYKEMNKTTPQDFKKALEVVFISGCLEKEEFEEYFKKMPWLAIDYDEAELREKVFAHFKVEGIPMLFILQDSQQAKEGYQIVTQKGYTEIMNNPNAKELLNSWNSAASKK